MNAWVGRVASGGWGAIGLRFEQDDLTTAGGDPPARSTPPDAVVIF
jgi:hypothetical protein